MVMTNKSKAEFLHPIITPGVVERVRLFGQKTRNMPLSFSTILTYFQVFRRNPAFEVALEQIYRVSETLDASKLSRDSLYIRQTHHYRLMCCNPIERYRN